MRRHTAAAWSFVTVVVFVVLGGMSVRFPHWLTGIIAWSACLLLWPRLTQSQARIVLALVGVGAMGVVWGTAAGKSGLIERALAQNIPLIGMLIAVSSLQLIIVLAWIGFHPVIMVSVVGPWLAPLDPDPNLVAMTFLMTWGVGLTGCPMSNTLLAMKGRYQAPFAELLRENRAFSLRIALLCVVVIHLYANVAVS